MKPNIKPIPDLNVRIILPRLTQPEEVDQILMALAAQKQVAGASYRKINPQPQTTIGKVEAS